MAILDLTAVNAVLETQYTQSKVQNLCYEESKAYAKTKKKKWVGGPKHVAFRYGSVQGRGANFTVALGNMSPTTYGAVDVTRKTEYCFAELQGETIEAAQGQPGALLDVVKTEFDSAFYTAARSIGIAMFQAGGGARGQVGSFTGATITLKDINQVVNFEKNMVINLGSTDGTSGAKRTGTLTVSGVDRATGVLTFSANVTTGIAAAANNDYIFQNGDFESTKSMISGIPAWIPKVAPTAGDNFFGLDRSGDTRLSGCRVTKYSGGPIEETLIQAAAYLRREGGKPDAVYMNPLDVANLMVALGSKVIYDRSTAVDKPDFGWEGVFLRTPGGRVEIIDDINVPTGDAWMLTSSTWSFEDTMGKGPHILDQDGNKLRANATGDSYIARIGYYGNLICEAPGWNAYVAL